MDELPPNVGAGHDGDDVGPNRGSTIGTPRRVIGFWFVAVVLVLLFVLHLAGGGFRDHISP